MHSSFIKRFSKFILFKNLSSITFILLHKILGQTFKKVLVLRNGDEYLRSMRVLLRDFIRNTRADIDVHQFTSELINNQLISDIFMSSVDGSVGNGVGVIGQDLCDFRTSTQTKERYVHSVCDLITSCMLVSITPQIKDAYQRMGRNADVLPEQAKNCLIKYYMLMSQIQSDTVAWLHNVVSRSYEINPSELVTCLFKVKEL